MEETLVNNGVATFISKLWKMLNQGEATNTMSWSTSGKSFVIKNQVLLITELLPMYFKHNNMGSFIRQLNLYDFHKICTDKSAELEYQHKYFLRDRPDLLSHIKRKLPHNKRTIYSDADREELINVSREIISMKHKQEEMVKQISLLQQENLSLWEEVSNLHSIHNTQSQILKKMIEILISSAENKNRKEAVIENGSKIFELNTRKFDTDSIWTDHGQLEFKRNNLFTYPENFDTGLKLCNTSNFDSIHRTNGFMDLKELLVNINQPINNRSIIEDHIEHKSEKNPGETINCLDNDLSTLLDNDVLECPLLMEGSDDLDQHPK